MSKTIIHLEHPRDTVTIYVAWRDPNGARTDTVQVLRSQDDDGMWWLEVQYDNETVARRPLQ